MFETIQKYWKIVIFVSVVVGIVWQGNSIKVDAADSKQMVEQHNETFDDLKQIAIGLDDPNRSMREFLLLHQVDTTLATQWSRIARGALKDKNDKPYTHVHFISTKELPYIGVLKTYIDASTVKVLDTLWNFNKDRK